MTDRHLVDVWNPSYASDSMEAHLRILLDQARLYDGGEADEDALHVWWGKVRSPNRQQPLRHMDDILGLKAELDEDPERELQLYLTDYRSLYVADVEQIVLEDMSRVEPTHVPAYYTRKRLTCDFWYRLGDIRRLVTDDTLLVIAELALLRSVSYHDRPVSLYGGMVDLPLIVTRPDGRQFFDSEEMEAVTEGRLWAEFDAEAGGVGAMERELRENLFGDETWMALEPATRTFIATAEKIYRDHRSDPAFDFGPVVANLAKAIEVSCNAVLSRIIGTVNREARLMNMDGRTVDLAEQPRLMLGQFARVVGGERALNQTLSGLLENGPWFTGSLPAIVQEVVEIRNPGVHGQRVERERATRLRNRLLGIGCQGVLVDLARVRPRRPT